LKRRLELRPQRGYLSTLRGIQRSPTDDLPGDGGPDEAVAFIAETVSDLARLARRHQLDVLVRLLEMAQMEAQERIRLRGKRSLS